MEKSRETLEQKLTKKRGGCDRRYATGLLLLGQQAI
jgi:hypothetical protein